MNRPLVYLAGAIAGISGLDAADWRQEAKMALSRYDIETLSPLRGKDALCGPARISTDFRDYDNKGPFFTSRGIMARDFNDVKRCDVLLVNLIGCAKPSMGTVMELGWAYAMQKPAVVVMEATGNVHDLHPMLHEAIPFRVETLDEAVHVVAVILNR